MRPSPTRPTIMPARAPEMVAIPILWGSVLLAATLAAVAAWLLGESGLGRVAPEKTDVMLMGVKLHDVTTATVRAAELRSAVVIFASFGGVLGLATGLAGGLTGRSLRTSALAALVGLVAGGAAGGLAPVGVLPAYHSLASGGFPEPLTALVAHAGIWAPIGAAAGLALGLGLGGRGRALRALTGGVFGALLGAVAFDVVGALAFPLDETSRPVSTTALSRLVARLLAAVPSAAVALAAASGRGAEYQRTASERPPSSNPL